MWILNDQDYFTKSLHLGLLVAMFCTEKLSIVVEDVVECTHSTHRDIECIHSIKWGVECIHSMATIHRMYTFYSTNCRIYTFYNSPIECIHSTSLAIECIHSMTFYILYNIYTYVSKCPSNNIINYIAIVRPFPCLKKWKLFFFVQHIQIRLEHISKTLLQTKNAVTSYFWWLSN